MGNTVVKFLYLGLLVSILSGCASGVVINDSLNTQEINNQIASLAKVGHDRQDNKQEESNSAKLTLTDMSSEITSKQAFVLKTFLAQQQTRFSFATLNLSMATNDYGSISTSLANARKIKAILEKDGIKSEIMVKPDGVPGQLVVSMVEGAAHAK